MSRCQPESPKSTTTAQAKPKRIRMEVAPQSRGDQPWKVTRNGDRIAQCRTQRDGIALAVTLCWQAWNERGQTSELYIKRPDGTIRDPRTYPRSSDPRKSRG